MRKFYREYLYVPKHGKICDKVMITRVAISVAVVVMCLMAMSFTAYAYFSHNVISSSNVIHSASFEVKISVEKRDGSGELVNVDPVTSDRKLFKISGLQPLNTYTVTVRPTEGSTVNTGFLVVTATDCEQTYYTQQLWTDGESDDVFTFTFTVTDTTDAVFRAHWGTSSQYPDYRDNGVNGEWYITDGETIAVAVTKTPVTTSTTTTTTTTITATATTTATGTATTTTTTAVTETTTATQPTATDPVAQTTVAAETTTVTSASTTEAEE